MRADPALKTCRGVDPSDRHLASQPTLSRWEDERGPKSCYAVARALLESYLLLMFEVVR